MDPRATRPVSRRAAAELTTTDTEASPLLESTLKESFGIRVACPGAVGRPRGSGVLDRQWKRVFGTGVADGKEGCLSCLACVLCGPVSGMRQGRAERSTRVRRCLERFGLVGESELGSWDKEMGLSCHTRATSAAQRRAASCKA